MREERVCKAANDVAQLKYVSSWMWAKVDSVDLPYAVMIGTDRYWRADRYLTSFCPVNKAQILLVFSNWLEIWAHKLESVSLPLRSFALCGESF